MDKLFVVIPAYNEEDNLKEVVSSWHDVVSKLDISSDSRIIVINDGSKDNTYKVGKELEKEYPYFRIIDKSNEGHGATVLYGYNYAINNNANYIFQTDSDGQTNPKEFVEFWENRHDYDAIFGVRSKREDGISRVFVEKVVCLLVRIIFGVSVPDANAPFRLMKASFVEKYIRHMPEKYNIPNIVLTTLFVYYGNKVKFIEISFGKRTKGTNSINIKKIVKIGINAINDFIKIKNTL